MLAAAVGYWDRPGKVVLWDFVSRRVLRTFPTPLGPASVAFSPDGRRIGAAGYNARGYVWDLSTGREEFTLKLDGPARLAFSPDGKLIATATETKTVKLWDAASGKEIAALTGDLFRFHCVTFSHDGKLLAAGGGDWDGNGPSQVTLWDVKGQKQVGKLPTLRPVLGVAFSPDDGTVVTGDLANAVKVWDASSFRLKASLEGHQGWVEGLAFSPDGATLASSAHDATIRIWDFRKRAERARLDGLGDAVRSVAFTPDGKTLVSGGSQRSVKLWDAATGKEIATLLQGEDRADAPAVLATAFSPDGKTLALAADDGDVQLPTPGAANCCRALKGHTDKATCLAFSPDGKLLASGSPDKTVRLWDPASGEQGALARRPQQLGVRRGVLARRQAAGRHRLRPNRPPLGPGDGQGGRRAEGPHGGGPRAGLPPDGKTLASAGGDKVIRLWNIPDFTERDTLKGA